jgi:hypothetical protein
MAPCQSTTIHYNFKRHVIDPFFSIFWIQYVLDNLHKLKYVLSCCYISKIDILSHIYCNTMILCSHKQDVDKYNNLLIHEFFSTSWKFHYNIGY